MTNKEWFKQAGFGMMIHWGLYSVLAGEWNGRRTTETGWEQAVFRMPIAEYEKLASAFNPVFFDPDQWVLMAKEAGMKYIVITSKHHEGFAMYHSQVSPYNVVDATPFGRDVIGELHAACKRHGLRLGLYYSQDLDWHEAHGGGYTMGHTNVEGCSWTNDWDFPDNASKQYARCFEEKIKPQVKEIMQKYDDLLLIWFDTPVTISPEQSRELYDIVKHYQKDCLVNSRIGNGMGDYRSMEDNEIPDTSKPGELWESPVTMQNSWGYKAFDNIYKPVDELLRIKKHLQEQGVNFLLNVTPDYLGRIPLPSQQVLQQIGKQG